MAVQEILKKYQGEWVLIEYTKLDDELRVQEGEVVAHSPRKEDLYALLPEYKGTNFTIEYAGEFADELAVLF